MRWPASLLSILFALFQINLVRAAAEHGCNKFKLANSSATSVETRRYGPMSKGIICTDHNTAQGVRTCPLPVDGIIHTHSHPSGNTSVSSFTDEDMIALAKTIGEAVDQSQNWTLTLGVPEQFHNVHPGFTGYAMFTGNSVCFHGYLSDCNKKLDIAEDDLMGWCFPQFSTDDSFRGHPVAEGQVILTQSPEGTARNLSRNPADENSGSSLSASCGLMLGLVGMAATILL